MNYQQIGFAQEKYKKLTLIFPSEYTLNDEKIFTAMKEDSMSSDIEKALLGGVKAKTKIIGGGIIFKTDRGVEIGYEQYELQTKVTLDMTDAAILMYMNMLGISEDEARQMVSQLNNLESRNTLDSKLAFFTLGYSYSWDSLFSGVRFSHGQALHSFGDDTENYDDKGTYKLSANGGIKLKELIVGLEYHYIVSKAGYKDGGYTAEIDLSGSHFSISLGIFF